MRLPVAATIALNHGGTVLALLNKRDANKYDLIGLRAPAELLHWPADIEFSDLHSLWCVVEESNAWLTMAAKIEKSTWYKSDCYLEIFACAKHRHPFLFQNR